MELNELTSPIVEWQDYQDAVLQPCRDWHRDIDDPEGEIGTRFENCEPEDAELWMVVAHNVDDDWLPLHSSPSKMEGLEALDYVERQIAQAK